MMNNLGNSKKDRGIVSIPKKKDTMLRALQFLAVSAGLFAWWMAMLLLISLFAVNIWSVTFTEILFWSLGLTGISAVVYLLIMIRRERKKQEVAR